MKVDEIKKYTPFSTYDFLGYLIPGSTFIATGYFFDEEVDKLEKWSEDVRNSIKFEIKELDKEIKTRKTEARKLLNLEQKVKEQRTIKDLEKKLAEKRYNQYQNEDDIEHRKDNLLEEVEQRLKQQTTELALFTIRWKVI